MEQRSRSWSATRLKARVWTNFLCLRLFKLSILIAVVLFYFIYLARFIKTYEEEWRPQKFLRMTHISFELGFTKPAKMPEETHVCMDSYQGGLGNRMFQFAAVYVAAMISDKTIRMSVKDAMHLPFETSARAFYYFRCQGQTLAERLPCSYDQRLLKRTSNERSTVLHGYWQSWKYFRHYELDLRRQFKFTERVRSVRDEFLDRFRNLTLIGVHVRRGDMLLKDNVKYGYQLPGDGYFHKAMNWFRERFSDAIFVVCSNDIKYTKGLFSQETDVFYSEKHNPAEDMAILAACEHVVMSVGTFGWWGGWLAGGQTIYYKNFSRPGSEFDNDFVAEDFFPPTWIGME